MKNSELFNQYKSRPTRDSLAALLRAYENTVYNVCYQVLRHAQNAEDASQKVFMEVIGRLGKTTDSEHFRRLIHQIAFHIALNAKKESQTRHRYERMKADLPAHPSKDTRRSAVFDTLHDHIARLDDELRSLVVDYYFEGKKLEGLAARQRCSTVAIWKRLENAKEALRRSLVGAGLAGMVALLDSTLEAMTFCPAPRDLVGPIVAAHASATGTSGMVASTLTLGGFVVTKKAALVLGVSLLIAASGGSAIFRWRESRELEMEHARSAMKRSVDPSGSSQQVFKRAESTREKAAPRKLSLQAETPTLLPQLTPMELWREAERRAVEDFEAALRWARTLPKGLNRDRALSCLSLCLCGIAGTDALRAVELASEIEDPALRLHAQGEVAKWWVHFQPVNALAWAVSLPEKAVPSTPPEDEKERIYYYFYDSRRLILMCCIQAWTAPSQNADGVRVYPQEKVDAARRWIEEAPLYPEMKTALVGSIQKAR